MKFEIRKERTGQGRRKLVREREEYFRLMDQGARARPDQAAGQRGDDRLGQRARAAGSRGRHR
ncbi:hypothetical protein STRMOE7_00540 [Streptomyces sp. MOE7]|nr:hypothetical protein STRMOE7_00540 [Streptomyces sp. MOE7]